MLIAAAVPTRPSQTIPIGIGNSYGCIICQHQKSQKISSTKNLKYCPAFLQKIPHQLVAKMGIHCQTNRVSLERTSKFLSMSESIPLHHWSSLAVLMINANIGHPQFWTLNRPCIISRCDYTEKDSRKDWRKFYDKFISRSCA